MDMMEAHLGEELYKACIDGDLEVTKSIIHHNRASTPDYLIPLSSMIYIAASEDRPNIVQYCLDNNATVDPETMKIVLINKSKSTYATLLASKAVDVNFWIPWFGDILSNFATHDNFDWTNLCLRHGADPNKNLVNQHMSILAVVAERASTTMAQLLIDHGAHVKGSGAIVLAAGAGRLDMVKLLLANGANINEIGIEHLMDARFKEDMGSALHKAVKGGHEEVARFLIGNGANVGLKDPMGRMALDVARESGNGALIRLLEE